MASKIRTAVFEGIRKRTQEFNERTFPQAEDDWTPEQREMWEFVNGESGAYTRLNDSDRPEVLKILSKMSGVDLSSRHIINNYVTIPPYTAFVLRSAMEGYPEMFPLVAGRIQGAWTESGQGSSRGIAPKTSQLRPATEDDIKTFGKKFPEEKLEKLYGAIQFSDEEKLRLALADNIKARAVEFGKKLVDTYPEGVTDKGLAIMKLGLPESYVKAISIVLDDPEMLKPFKPALNPVHFDPFSAVVHKRNGNGMTYALHTLHIQCDLGPDSDVFFNVGDEEDVDSIYGNHADRTLENLRIATPEEIDEYFSAIGSRKLHLYASALTAGQVAALI